jgi:hypothetical protein
MGKKIRLKKRPSGNAKLDDFELVKVKVPELKEEVENSTKNNLFRSKAFE